MRKASLSEHGSIMVITLLMFLLLGVWGGSIVEIGIMEYKSCSYEIEAQQSRLTADGGIDWGMERIYSELIQPENLGIDVLPAQLSCGDAEMNLIVDSEEARVSIGLVQKVSELGNEPNACTYEFTSTAFYKGAQRAVKVQVKYSFSGGYESINEGNPYFIPRTYLNHGKIINYEPTLII